MYPARLGKQGHFGVRNNLTNNQNNINEKKKHVPNHETVYFSFSFSAGYRYIHNNNYNLLIIDTISFGVFRVISVYIANAPVNLVGYI